MPSDSLKLKTFETEESSVCISGQILRGLKKPHECPAFGKELHAANAAGRDDGFSRRGLRRLLSLWPASRTKVATTATTETAKHRPDISLPGGRE